MDKIESAITVVCDAGPAIHLDELGCLELLKDFQEILLPNKDMPLQRLKGSSKDLLTNNLFSKISAI